jgi:hypothetical protein
MIMLMMARSAGGPRRPVVLVAIDRQLVTGKAELEHSQARVRPELDTVLEAVATGFVVVLDDMRETYLSSTHTQKPRVGFHTQCPSA